MSRSHPPTTAMDAHPPRSPLRCHPADEHRDHEHVAKKPDVYYSIPVAGIDDAVFQGLSRFEETKLTDEAIGFDPTSVLGALKSGENPLFVDDSKTTRRGWVGWPDTARSETQTQTREGSQRMKQDFVQYINRIGQAVAESTGRSDVPRKWTAKYCRSVVPGSNSALKPDFVLMRSDNADSPDTAQHGWRSIFAVGVIASGERTTSHARITTLASYAAKMFVTQPDRRYVLGFSVDGDRVEYVLFNRSGVYVSDEFNVHDRPERLVRVVAGMMFARRGAMGFDPSMKLTLFDETEPTEAYIEIDKKRYPIVELLSVEGTIRGRSTTVCEVENPEWDGGTKDGYLIVKRQWVTRDKVKEYAILNELRDVPYVPKVVAFQASGESDTSRADFDEWRMSHLPEGEDIASMVARMDCLVEVRMAITPVGESLLHFRSLKELVHVFITIVDAIGALHEKGYLHYDVSASNVMIDISDPTTKGLRNGLLTDFDCATHEKDRPQGEVTDRIGTYSFMAVDLLASGKTQHEFYHDLESLFYVICYISCVSAGPNGATSDVELMDTPLASWFDTENKILPKIGKAKYKTVNNRKDFETVLSAFHPYFEPLKPYVRKLRGVAIPPDPDTVLCLMDYMNWSEDDVPFRFKPMDVKAGELLKEYRAVLQEALEAMPDDDVKQDDGDKQQPDVVHGADTQNKSESRNDEMDGSRTVVDKGSDGCHLGKRKRDASDEGDKCDVVH